MRKEIGFMTSVDLGGGHKEFVTEFARIDDDN